MTSVRLKHIRTMTFAHDISYDENNTQVRQVGRTYGPEGESLTVTYDALHRLKTLKDGNNNTTTYAYNSIGLPSTITMPGNEVTQFTSYPNDGNRLIRVRPGPVLAPAR